MVIDKIAEISLYVCINLKISFVLCICEYWSVKKYFHVLIEQAMYVKIRTLIAPEDITII